MSASLVTRLYVGQLLQQKAFLTPIVFFFNDSAHLNTSTEHL
ncbi:hypothetical protein AQB9606_02550 [Aquabacterium sp. CECT 9606]|nr:hypothetical protein AQB9606_02550 [Aquabacterium sp. CECT 9606]